MKKIELYWQILISLVLGVLFGIFFTEQVPYVSWMGQLFMRGLNMVVVPLILTSIISGVANIGTAENFGRLGLKTISYYIITSTLATLTGLFLVNYIEPGHNTISRSVADSATIDGLDYAKESFGQTLLNMVPTNVFDSLAGGEMLSIIFFSMLFGFFITKVQTNSRNFLTNFFNSSFDVMMKITLFVIKFTPIGVFGIVSTTVAENIENLYGLADSMMLYMLTVILGLFIHSMITLPLIVRFIAKVNPWLHFKIMRSALLTAFSTSSSVGTLSLTMESIENKAGVSNKITSFTLPLGATINMDGTALYECVVAIFIAQVYGIELTIGNQIIIVITSLLASIGAAGIPMAGMIIISVILTAVGLPLEGIGLVMAVDRILDMFRTTVNVWSDGCGAVLVAKSEGETLKI